MDRRSPADYTDLDRVGLVS